MQSGKVASVGRPAATTESYVFSGNLQDSPGSHTEPATRDPQERGVSLFV
jgi:hypothetical protein